VKFGFLGDNDTTDDEKEVRMVEERPRHTQEPAEGSVEDVDAAGAERAGETDKDAEGPQPSQHTQEPAEGSEENVEERGAEEAGDNH
jgi:hypothetical protein